MGNREKRRKRERIKLVSLNIESPLHLLPLFPSALEAPSAFQTDN
jgi:hypothetical protein